MCTTAMDSEDSLNPQREQEQELLVLQSIFMEEFSERPVSRGRQIELRILPFPSEVSAENHTELLFTANLHPTYPIVAPKISLKAVRGLTDRELKLLQEEVTAASLGELLGHVQLMELAELCREFLRARCRCRCIDN